MFHFRVPLRVRFRALGLVCYALGRRVQEFGFMVSPA